MIGSQQLKLRAKDGGGPLGRTALHGCAFKAKASLAMPPLARDTRTHKHTAALTNTRR